MKHADVDIVVVGGGHAGVEAAHAAARRGARVALVTLRRDDIGMMSCNPAIGGLGKGHLVREIDALDGVMARVADKAGIQFRLLNRRKGPAVQGPRAQTDRALYRDEMQAEVRRCKRIRVFVGEAADILIQGQHSSGVLLVDGTEIRAAATVLTVGTFLGGKIYIGGNSRFGGRKGNKASIALAERLKGLGLPIGRLKTGTPPRLISKSIDWSTLETQTGDSEPVLFSFLSRGVSARQVTCGITHTNQSTHEIIRDNLERSSMYGGHINGVGPRYCPSVEDKVVRFADKTSHQVFLEPEGTTSDLVYPNGISTSLPADVQVKMVHSIRGLESAEIAQSGYAIEYDYVDPRALTSQLRHREIEGLYFAGQINGTTGYEEAAAQGLVAGLNAAGAALDLELPNFTRDNSYIGVMIDDLTTHGVSEPYRMFTSRAEFRLSLRADNADQRLTPMGISINCINARRKYAFEDKMRNLRKGRQKLARETISAGEAARAGVRISADGVKRSALDLLSFVDVDFSTLARISPALADVKPTIQKQLKNDALYEQYIRRQDIDVKKMRDDEAHAIPYDFEFSGLQGLSNELRQKLAAANPETLGQASRIEGMTPAALTLILAKLRQRECSRRE